MSDTSAMARTYQFVVGAGEAGWRLDRYLARHLPTSVSRAMIQRRITGGGITVADRPVKAHDKVRAGDIVSARFDQLPARGRALQMQPQEIPLDVVYEDDQLLVVNKPPGLVTHPAPGHWDSTLVNAILWHLANAECGMRNAELSGKEHSALRTPNSALSRAGIVHRLDKDTSGLLLVAKTEMAHAALSKQLKARTIHRRYVAVVEGRLPLETGTVNVPIGRHLTHRKQMTVRHLGGRSAVTHYRVIKRFENAECGMRNAELKPGIPNSEFPIPNYTLIEVKLETGRTHQIRVHMAHLGYPVVGDTTYGKHPASFWQVHGITRQLLHAYQVSFQHPVTKRPVTLTAPVPADMAPWIANLPLGGRPLHVLE